MAYLDNTTVTIDAILTKKGRELFAKSSEKFKITKFALADDEIDYRLYDKAHPSGSNYYSAAIQGLPLLEALPDGSKMLRYKLVSLPKSTSTVPIITVPSTSYTLYIGEELGLNSNLSPGTVTIVPQTTNGLNRTLGYTATLYDSTYVRLTAAGGGAPIIDQEQGITTVTGTSFTLTAGSKYLPSSAGGVVNTTLDITGNETGGLVKIAIRIVQKTKEIENEV